MSRAWAQLSARLQRALLGDASPRIGLRLRLLFLWLVALALAAVVLPARIWTTLLIGLIGLIAIAFLWARALARGLSAERRLKFGWVSVGDRLEEEFTLVNRSGVPALWVEVHDETSVPGYRAAAVRSAGSDDRVRWRQASICTQRGQYHLGPWAIETGDPFGLFRVTRRYEAREEIIIHPPIHAALPIPLPPGRSDGRARTRERNWQVASNAAGVREYHTLDPFHWIHWPTSARKDSLYVRQFERDAAGDIWLIIDAQASVQLGEGPQGTEEHAVLLAAALSARALDETRAVGLAAFAQQPQLLPPALGAGQQWRILRALALLRTNGEIDLARALQELGDVARRGSAAIIITPAIGGDWLPQLPNLSRRGLESHILLLDRPSFGGDGNSEALRNTIALLGYPCHVVRRGELGRPLIDEVHRGYWEFRVTGTGRAIAVRRPSSAEQ